MNLVTETREGVIPHLRLMTDVGEIQAPVKLKPNAKGKIVGTNSFGNAVLPEPMRRNGRLVFALPGGGEVLSD